MSNIYPIKPVGTVRNDCHDAGQAAAMRDTESVIEVDEAYADGLFSIESCEFVDVVFYFHQAEAGPNAPSWRHRTKSGEERGVFASRSPWRPNLIGITTVRLTGRDGNRLRVTGLDAINGTPVLDIKSCDTSHLDDLTCGAAIHTSILKSNPRIAIQKHILAGDTEKLLMMAAQFHGHYCPGLSMGVMAAVYAMQKLGPDDSDGLEDLLAIVETNNCFADGVQLVTGCSFGNNSLIFHDLGKTAFTLTRRDGNGVRVISRHEAPDYIRKAFPDFDERYRRVVRDQLRDEAEVAAYKKSGIERSFGTLRLDFERMFDTQRVKVPIPDYAPSHASEVCAHCGESVMATRTVEAGSSSVPGSSPIPGPSPASAGAKLCLKCAGAPYAVLDGHGIRTSD